MKYFKLIILTIGLAVLAFPGAAAVLVDDTWADGSRTEQNLPDESAWYSSTAGTGSLNPSPGVLVATVPDTSSRTWWTYFTDDPALPATLEVGQTLNVTVEFSLSGVAPENTNRGFRVGLYNVSGGTRQAMDSGSPDGTGITGYMLNMNFGQTFGANNPLQIRERTSVSAFEWMSASGAYTTLSGGGGASGSPGFSDGVPYTMEFSVTRNAGSVEVTTTFSDNLGWSISHTATDSVDVTDGFDTFAIRPAQGVQSASEFRFTRLLIEILGTATPSPPEITTQPASQAVTVGDSVTFTVAASGSAPLSYQWYQDTTLLGGEIDSTLSIENVQQSHAGSYTVVVTNPHGSDTSDPAILTVNEATAPSITAPPQDQTVTVGQNATFTVEVTGTEPLSYQWYFNVSTPVGNDAILALNNVQPGDAGSYHVVVSNSLGTDTSAAATLTVNPVDPNITVIVNDTWADGSRNETNLPDESAWYSSAASSLVAREGSLLGTNITSARMWLTYFTAEPSAPVDLPVGQMIRATLVFTPTNVAAFSGGTQRGVRFGLLNFADGGTRLPGDTFGSGSDSNGENVTGYMLNQNFYSVFSLDAPMELRARNAPASSNLMGTTADYPALGTGPDGYLDEPGFESGVPYTLEFSVVRHENSVDVKTRITGGALDLLHTETDSEFRYHRFDCFAIRVNNLSQSADHFHFTQFKVETLPAPAEEVPFSITGVERLNADQLQITWQSVAGHTYEVQARDDVAGGTWVVVDSVTAGGTSAAATISGISSGVQRFYRVVDTE